ncbi:TetR/AcrR family transcriptional regulator [Streptomyces sp. VRA16 Mangrove soil]|uniref:TetR/AcrR family transcriptional regulator n=1 Tax=Streptomyces sp. VRA16 Mangrove soil TaxID=2817434 RepID=UPI001A9D6251|nr:TetR/AcrR family transcriptional regulator [Streptomyces sp. VRA16 Mangrove soil]MBO1330003.1 TetR/AcrR family transcriptional regulator [Streptomyces sp. VRA16 Mangrove soil]
MARRREFDTDVAVGRAMRLFRRQSYHGTPMPQVMALLGIGSGSLYAAFGSKDGLYARALARHCDELVAELDRGMNTGADVRTALHTFLTDVVAAGLDDPERGCLLVRAATERTDHGPTAQRVEETMAAVESVLTGALEQARARGELGGGHSPVELARFLTTFVQGLHVMSNARADRAFLESAVAGALRALD